LRSAQQLNQFIANHPDYLLPGSQRFHDLLSKSPLFNALDKILCDFKMYIRVEQGIADFTGSLLDMAS
jgi:hypothetical protein